MNPKNKKQEYDIPLDPNDGRCYECGLPFDECYCWYPDAELEDADTFDEEDDGLSTGRVSTRPEDVSTYFESQLRYGNNNKSFQGLPT